MWSYFRKAERIVPFSEPHKLWHSRLQDALKNYEKKVCEIN